MKRIDEDAKARSRIISKPKVSGPNEKLKRVLKRIIKLQNVS